MGHTWFTQLHDLVGHDAWRVRSAADKLALVTARADYLIATARLSKGLAALPSMPVGRAYSPSSSVLIDTIKRVAEYRRHEVESYIRAIVPLIFMAVDHTVDTAKKLNGSYVVSAANEKGVCPATANRPARWLSSTQSPALMVCMRPFAASAYRYQRHHHRSYMIIYLTLTISPP
jgi:hypothetical protein